MSRWLRQVATGGTLGALSLAVLAAVVMYLGGAIADVDRRQQVFGHIVGHAEAWGSCAALLEATSLLPTAAPALRPTLEGLRLSLAGDIVGGDRRGQEALLSATADRLVDLPVCEQIGLTHSTGELHPILGLLRFTRGGVDPCQDGEALEGVIAGLRSHRGRMLHVLMEHVGQLACLDGVTAARVAKSVASLVREEPAFFDRLDVLGVASFLSRWAPLDAAQLGCRAEARGDRSRLLAALGCTRYHLAGVLTRYRIRAAEGSRREGYEVGRVGEVCELRPVRGPPRLMRVPCAELEPVSDLDIAVLVDPVDLGGVEVDLVAGLGRFSGAERTLEPAGDQAPVPVWFGYDRLGRPLGTAHAVALSDLAARWGVDLPDNPMRSACRRAGARYCYDVDWAQVVSRLEGLPLVFLSRPAAVFVSPRSAPSAVAEPFEAAFGRPPGSSGVARAYILSAGARLVVDSQPRHVDLRWQLSAGERWRSQRLGEPDRASGYAAARLLAVLDVEHDGRPEVIVQTARSDGGREKEVFEAIDTVDLMRWDRQAEKFEVVNRLTVHEY